jgi:hypothetical protein
MESPSTCLLGSQVPKAGDSECAEVQGWGAAPSQSVGAGEKRRGGGGTVKISQLFTPPVHLLPKNAYQHPEIFLFIHFKHFLFRRENIIMFN